MAPRRRAIAVPTARRRRGWRAPVALAAAATVAFLAWATVYAISMQPRILAVPALARARVAQSAGTWVPYDRIPRFLVHALVATEDRSFWTNPGVSFEGTARAVVVDIEQRAFVQGGSTLQQQIVRDLFLTPRKTLWRKLRGSVLSVLLTLDFPRSEIMAFYWNEVYLGAGSYGLASAARVYFGRAPSALTPAQCALLAGLPQAPSAYDPLVHLAAAKARQAVVLDSMMQAGYLSAAQARALSRAPLELRRS